MIFVDFYLTYFFEFSMHTFLQNLYLPLRLTTINNLFRLFHHFRNNWNYINSFYALKYRCALQTLIWRIRRSFWSFELVGSNEQLLRFHHLSKSNKIQILSANHANLSSMSISSTSYKLKTVGIASSISFPFGAKFSGLKCRWHTLACSLLSSKIWFSSIALIHLIFCSKFAGILFMVFQQHWLFLF